MLTTVPDQHPASRQGSGLTGSFGSMVTSELIMYHAVVVVVVVVVVVLVVVATPVVLVVLVVVVQSEWPYR